MKYIVPIIAVVALGLSVLNALPSKMVGGQYSTNHAYFAGITNQGTLTQTGAVALTGDLTNTGAATVTGATALNGGLTMDTNKFSVADTTGNTLVGGTFGVTGISTLATSSLTAVCVKNAGGEWVKITFSDATPSYATSTTCL